MPADKFFISASSDLDIASNTTLEETIPENEAPAATYVQNTSITKNVASNCPPLVSLANCTRANINVNIYNDKN